MTSPETLLQQDCGFIAEVLPALPRSAIGKVLKRELRENASMPGD